MEMDATAAGKSYLKYLSLGRCRASEEVFLGKRDIYHSSIIVDSDYLFGTNATPRKVNSETFDSVKPKANNDQANNDQSDSKTAT